MVKFSISHCILILTLSTRVVLVHYSPRVSECSSPNIVNDRSTIGSPTCEKKGAVPFHPSTHKSIISVL